MLAIQKKISAITSAGAVPFCIGGDHSFSPAIVRAIGRSSKGKIGVVHFDSHFDNAERFNEDTYPRCSPLHHIAHLPQIKKTSIVHVGIRGPRNSKRQMQYARELGASVLTIQDIRRDGMDKTMDKAIFTAGDGTDGLYVTVCSDIIDVAFNPGGPPDFDGLTPHELFYAVRRLGAHGIIGFDFVEIYPLQDKNNVSAHLAAWSMIHALAGMAMRKRDSQRSKLP
jgi:agmatinase